MTKRIGGILLTLVGFMSLGSTNKHEYYVSVTKVEYVKEQKALQVITQIFIDDFEELIRKRYDDKIVLAVKDENEKVGYYIERYLSDKLRFNINGSEYPFVFLGKKYEDDIVYCYLEIEHITAIKALSITNNILYDLYDEQENIIRTKINGKNKSFVLNKANNEALLNFN